MREFFRDHSANQRFAEFYDAFLNPGREFSQAPFWFWNDDLSEDEIARQMADFRAHGVYGFVIHPRAGLPRSIGWMSERMLHFIRFAVEEASRNDMWVVLYDEGMYPSGSSAGQVVAVNPEFRPHGLFCEQDTYAVDENNLETLVAVVKRENGDSISIVDRPIKDGFSVIRGLHFTEDDPPRRTDKKEVPENLPPAADILNPDAVKCFIDLVYQRLYDEMPEYFGNTIQAIFTDEPSFLGKRPEPGAMPGNDGTAKFASEFLGYDFSKHLSALWYDDEPDAEYHRKNYLRVLNARLEKSYYQQLFSWCEGHNIALTGHPDAPDDIGNLKYFHIPGQDAIARYIEPGKESALSGAQSTQAKAASSAMIHQNKRRNSNEYCGNYGHDFTFEEMKWLAYWLLIRGCNMLYPHAFYYSVRGPRIDERPPDVGPNSRWWNQFQGFADVTDKLCWLNTDSKHVCSVAILGLADYLPWHAAKACFQHQYDFNYVESNQLLNEAGITDEGFVLGEMCYRTVIVESGIPTPPERILDSGRIINWRVEDGEAALFEQLGRLTEPEVRLDPPCVDVRVRHVVKLGMHCFVLFNEGENPVRSRVHYSVRGGVVSVNPISGEVKEIQKGDLIELRSHEIQIIVVDSKENT